MLSFYMCVLKKCRFMVALLTRVCTKIHYHVCKAALKCFLLPTVQMEAIKRIKRRVLLILQAAAVCEGNNLFALDIPIYWVQNQNVII